MPPGREDATSLLKHCVQRYIGQDKMGNNEIG